MTIFCATTNHGKLREFRLAIETFGKGRYQLETVPGLKDIEPPEETGQTFAENAIIKAVYYSRFVDGLVFADDSGLAVNALDGAPGVYSARFAGPDATDERNNTLLLEKLKDAMDRSAQFVCVIALARDGEPVRTFDGFVRGVMAHQPAGTNGFGYDPLFFYPPKDKMFAELTPEEKLWESHRGKALHQMIDWLGGARP